MVTLIGQFVLVGFTQLEWFVLVGFTHPRFRFCNGFYPSFVSAFWWVSPTLRVEGSVGCSHRNGVLWFVGWVKPTGSTWPPGLLEGGLGAKRCLSWLEGVDVDSFGCFDFDTASQARA